MRESEIRALQQQVESLQKDVITDPLTNIYNKRHFLDALNREMERTRRGHHPTSLILLDIDHFKSVNDRYGHLAGDQVLQKLAYILKNAMRVIDIPCRYGGEEFALILPSTPLLTAIQVAERLRESIEQTPIGLPDGQALKITASLGVSAFQAHHTFAPDDLIEKADKQLYRAKHGGRNQVCADTVDKQKSTQLSEQEKDALFGNDE